MRTPIDRGGRERAWPPRAAPNREPRMPSHRSYRTGRSSIIGAAVLVLAGIAATFPASAANPPAPPSADPRLLDIAHEARRPVAIIDAFYAEHHACPQPSRPEQLKELQSQLGDGFSAEPQGQLVAIGGISMESGGWFYFTSARYPDRCTLWRRLDGDAVLIWRRHRYGAGWAFSAGDGKPEIPIRLAP